MLAGLVPEIIRLPPLAKTFFDGTKLPMVAMPCQTPHIWYELPYSHDLPPPRLALLHDSGPPSRRSKVLPIIPVAQVRFVEVFNNGLSTLGPPLRVQPRGLPERDPLKQCKFPYFAQH
jgi:hypothetical protein